MRIWASFAEEQLSNLMNGSQCDSSVQVPGLLLELFKIPHFYLKFKPGAMLESIRSDALLPFMVSVEEMPYSIPEDDRCDSSDIE